MACDECGGSRRHLSFCSRVAHQYEWNEHHPRWNKDAQKREQQTWVSDLFEARYENAQLRRENLELKNRIEELESGHHKS
jgi:hypothetical protein